MKTLPNGSLSSKSTEVRTKFFAAYTRSRSRARRCSASTCDRRSWATTRHGVSVSPATGTVPDGRRMSSRQVDNWPRGPLSTNTSTISR